MLNDNMFNINMLIMVIINNNINVNININMFICYICKYIIISYIKLYSNIIHQNKRIKKTQHDIEDMI